MQPFSLELQIAIESIVDASTRALDVAFEGDRERLRRALMTSSMGQPLTQRDRAAFDQWHAVSYEAMKEFGANLGEQVAAEAMRRLGAIKGRHVASPRATSAHPAPGARPR